MLIVMKHGASEENVAAVVRAVEAMGYEAEPIPGRRRTAIALIGNDGRVDPGRLYALPGVFRVIHISPPYRKASRDWHPDSTVIRLPNGVRLGAREVVVIAGPCAVESEEQIVDTARRVRAAGATVLRGGAFKPRSSPYSFQGLGEEGLRMLAVAGRESGLAVVTEVLDADSVQAVAEHVDILQIGARNMQNYPLLRAAGRADRPVLLKRGMGASVEELLLAAEYVLLEGEGRVILCERGIRSFDPHARNLLDLTAIPTIKELSHLPIIADPSHGTGSRGKVPPLARAAVAAGADGVMVEVHPNPAEAVSDGAQSLTPEQFDTLMSQLRLIARAIGRDLAEPALAAAVAGA
ncbi:MAG: 3-deoxy-7-phosphoheptulonate synthase [Gemmatimonadota bacterium]|jgi:3-deoxy-7-phosphoheptulonate synthase|nr:MAG: 3-deoxy-7-phosphoheptulonate synthase [Gemmatimonadota bacterium]